MNILNKNIGSNMKIQHKYEKINGGFQRFRKPLKYIIMKKNQLKHIRLNS